MAGATCGAHTHGGGAARGTTPRATKTTPRSSLSLSLSLSPSSTQDVARATASLAAAATAGALSAVFESDRGSPAPVDATSASPSPSSSSSTLSALARAAGVGGGGGGRAEALLVLAVSAACRASTREYLDAMGYVRAPRPVPPARLTPVPGGPRPAAAAGLGSPDDAAATLTLVPKGDPAGTPARLIATAPIAASPPTARPTPARDPLLAALATVLEWASSPAGGASVAGAASAASAAAVGAWLDRGAAGGGWGALVGAVCAPDNVPGAERLARAGAAECVAALLEAARSAQVAAGRDRARRQAAIAARHSSGEDGAAAQHSQQAAAEAAEPSGLGGVVTTALTRVAAHPEARALALSLAAASASAGVRAGLAVAGDALMALPGAVRARVGGWVADGREEGVRAFRSPPRPPPPASSRPSSARSAAACAVDACPPLPVLPALAVALLGAFLAACFAGLILRQAAVLGGLCGEGGGGGGGRPVVFPWLAGVVCPRVT